ncbi:URC4/urg3 family protein [Mycobacterium sp. ITM-2016-00317]|uniref:URC4/urg3 family protein n=1 Tax=Mycobacterium sp. ITM-2016-00317 TaxID=2099694 RepID=UPI00287F4212|nr:URC4/urg3 family protein [Mycobacterium sp. ITM-2016-00317]WNG85280.1 URC4/urg3 family protein [Mycobacterium sp. ITM-2016-00317]
MTAQTHAPPDATDPAGAAALLRTTAAVRTRAAQLLERARAGDSRWFTVDDAALQRTAGEVTALTRSRFPDLRIPVHSRWRHFEAGGVDRRGDLAALLGAAGADERARAMIDLAVVSVLLDAGAGAQWGYTETRGTSVVRFTRSEGLAVASWHTFVSGAFSGDPDRPLQVDAAGLCALTEERLAAAFQVGPDNPLVGLAGRVALMHRLGDALAAQPEVFGAQGLPGGLYDDLYRGPAVTGEVRATGILARLLASLSRIWPSDNKIGDEPVGDCWRHDAVAGPGLTAGWLPLHKLSQWLTYSLLEPFEWAGVTVTGVDALTGLAEYRNGGLLLDHGALTLRDQEVAARSWAPADELVVEWRALTVALLDELAPLVRDRLGAGASDMPLACVLEGGTWAAGRAAAQRLRGGLPPLTVTSDGTVF